VAFPARRSSPAICRYIVEKAEETAKKLVEIKGRATIAMIAK
jgi:hypothetical protein